MLEFTDQEAGAIKGQWETVYLCVIALIYDLNIFTDTSEIEWSKKLPRFLFRGFHEASGIWTADGKTREEMEDLGSLNTKKYIIPYAFRPKGMKIMADLMAGPADRRPTTRNLIEGHVCNCSGPDEDCPVWGPTPFSSWTPDLSTALAFARLKWDTEEDDSVPINISLRQNPRVAVLDTHMLSRHAETQDVQVFHMKALANVFNEPDWDLRTEYLVYGKVHGPAYKVVCARQIQEVGELKGSCWWQPEKGPHHVEHVYRHDLTEEEVLKAKLVGELFRSSDDNRPDRTIAVMAAELARLQWDSGMPDPYPKSIGLDLSWENHDIDLVAATVARELDSLAQLDAWRHALVNASQCTGAMPNVGMMVNMLVDVQSRIPVRRTSTASERRRRANANGVSKPTRKPSIARKILDKIKIKK